MAGWIADLCRTALDPHHRANAPARLAAGRPVKKTRSTEPDVLKTRRLATGATSLVTVQIRTRPVRCGGDLILYRHRLIERRKRIKNAIHACWWRGRALHAGRDHMVGGGTLGEAERAGQADRRVPDAGRPVGRPLHLELDCPSTRQQRSTRWTRRLNRPGKRRPGLGGPPAEIPRRGSGLSELVWRVLDDPHRLPSVRQVSAYPAGFRGAIPVGQMARPGRISGPACSKCASCWGDAWG